MRLNVAKLRRQLERTEDQWARAALRRLDAIPPHCADSGPDDLLCPDCSREGVRRLGETLEWAGWFNGKPER